MKYLFHNVNNLLIISARNFGDAIISSMLINSIGKNFPHIEIDLFTYSYFEDIYKNNPYIRKIYYSNYFPTGINSKNFNIKWIIDFFSQIFRLRSKKYHVVFNNVGDFREIIIGKMINPKLNISVRWEKGHPFNYLIRRGFYFLADNFIKIEQNILNIYDIQKHFLKKLGISKVVPPSIFLVNDNIDKKKEILGIHPMASKKCKLWQWPKWKKLVRIMLNFYDEIWIFCAPKESKIIYEIFSEELLDNKKIKIKTGNLEFFFNNLLQLELLIGLDSFSIHAAYALGVKSIMLNGPNDYRIWLPPNAMAISKGGVCFFHPCYNKPKCVGTNFEYICMKAIEVEDVIKVIEDIKGR